ncbi:MAG: hypothetical protein WDN23_06265 [Edaphobacter sp.]
MSVLLLIVSLLLPLAPLAFGFSENIDASLPACCRTHGKHKCAVRMLGHAEQQSEQISSSPRLAQVTEKCPYTPRVAASTHSNSLWNQPQESIQFDIENNRTAIRITSNHSHSIGRANPKRGPPLSSEIA